MSHLVALCLAAIVSTTPASQGQARPDLSGTWTPERRADSPPPPPPPAPPAPPVGVPPPPPPPTIVSLTIRQSAGELRVERTMQLGAERAVYPFSYNLDGREATNQMGPIASKAMAVWSGDRLTITSTYYLDGKQVGRGTETYALEERQTDRRRRASHAGRTLYEARDLLQRLVASARARKAPTEVVGFAGSMRNNSCALN